jgi:hypothetical protein
MFPYLMMLSFPALCALARMRRYGWALLAVALVYWLAVGFRFQVGMDWNNYLSHFTAAKHSSFPALLFSAEPGFEFLMWLAHVLGGGYPFVNAVAALVFCWGFFAVAARCAHPLVAVTIATPLLVVAFAMSGTRQSMAMGIVYYLFATWEQRRLLVRVLMVLAASLFHFSAVFILIFVALSARVGLGGRIAGAIGAAALLGVVIILSPGIIGSYSELYVSGTRRLEAPGAAAQVGVVAAAALVYFLNRRRFIQVHGHHVLYENLAIAALAMVPAIAISSVGAYRFTLYLWPMAMYVLSGMLSLSRTNAGRVLYRLLAVAASVVLLVGWLTTSNSGVAWIPYKNWLLQPEGSRLWR